MPEDHPQDGLRQTAIDGVIAEGEVLRRVAGGFTFTEGPIWDPDSDTLIFSDIAESRQYTWRDGTLDSFRHPSNQANGNCFDLDGRVVSCEHASSHLVVHDHGGKRVRVLASHFEGKELNSPNDVVCDSRGRIWFTDPSFGRLREDLGILRDQELDFQGVFRLDPDGTLAAVVRDFKQPNGLCFSNDERQLFINDSWGPHIRVFDVTSDGSLSGGAVWAEITGEGEGVPDGMKVDLDGRLYCNGPGGVHVLAPDATKLGVIRTPEKSTNFCFAPDGLLFITACTSVYAIQTAARAKPMKHS
ncbi:SMP-30/gluconolactonase/LRE family protein [Marivita sp. S0852]|uniref:SMP-30/gluconolactonase/LRE family protein n=1 Tax=Marivita sp. S0852 TaxID=3373893 RepID=UPI003981EA4B